MRDFLNGILSFIGSTSLTDAEFDDIELESTEDPYQVYLTLAQILNNRDAVSTMGDRLIYYYAAQGLDYSQSSKGKSNIFLGRGLCK